MSGGQWGALLGAIGVILAAYITAKYAGRSSVEVAQIEATAKERQAKRDDFEAVADRLQLALDRADAKIEALERDVEEFKQRERERDARDEAQRTVLMVHSGWDWNVLDLARRADPPLVMPDPPPLTPPHVPTQRMEGGD